MTPESKSESYINSNKFKGDSSAKNLFNSENNSHSKYFKDNFESNKKFFNFSNWHKIIKLDLEKLSNTSTKFNWSNSDMRFEETEHNGQGNKPENSFSNFSKSNYQSDFFSHSYALFSDNEGDKYTKDYAKFFTNNNTNNGGSNSNSNAKSNNNTKPKANINYESSTRTIGNIIINNNNINVNLNNNINLNNTYYEFKSYSK